MENKELKQLKEESAKLEKRIGLEELILQLSSYFINLSFERVDGGINFALNELGEFMGVDHSFLLLFSSEEQVVERTYEWVRESCAALIKDFNLDLNRLSYFKEQFNNFKNIYLSQLEELDTRALAEKEYLVKRNISSILMLPLFSNRSLIGVMGLSSIQGQKKYSKKMIRLIKIMSEVFINALEHKWDEEELHKYSEELAKYAMELESNNVKLELLSKKLNQQIEKAWEIHQQFLPTDFPEIKNLSCAAHYQPAESLGGDFYNLLQFGDKLIVYLVDITGHGLDGAMLNIFVRESINNFLLKEYEQNEGISPSRIIQYIFEKYSQESFPEDYFVCLLLGVLDLDKMEITFSNAGFQIPPLILSPEGEVGFLSVTGLPISNVIEDTYFEQHRIIEQSFKLSAGSTILLSTDGIIEEARKGEVYSEERLQKVFADNYYLPPEVMIQLINQDFKEFAGALQGQDDITLTLLQHQVKPLEELSLEIESSCNAMYRALKKLSNFMKTYIEKDELLTMGLQEMISNAIEHGNQMDINKKVKIKATLTKNYIKIAIEDQGTGFNWRIKLLDKADTEKIYTPASDRGRGIMLAEMAYDYIYYNHRGNCVTLIKLI